MTQPNSTLNTQPNTQPNFNAPDVSAMMPPPLKTEHGRANSAGRRVSPPGKAPSTRARLMRVLVPFIFFIALVLFGLFAQYENTQLDTQVRQSQTAEADLLQENVENWVEANVNDVSALGTSPEIREFGNQSLTSVSGTVLGDAQQAMLARFTALMELNPCSYLGVRYITYTGTEWSAVTDPQCDGLTVTRGIRLSAFSGDAEVRAALNSRAGTVIIGNPEVSPLEPDAAGETNPDAGSFERQHVYARFTTPVAVSSDVTNIAGAVQVDVSLDGLLAALQDEVATRGEFEVNRQVVLSDSNLRLLLNTADSEFNAVRNLTLLYPTELGAAAPQAEGLIAETGGEQINNAVERGDYFVSTLPLYTPDDSDNPYLQLAIVDDADLVSGIGLARTVTAFAILMAAAALISFAVYRMVGRVFKPLELVGQTARQVLSGERAAAGSLVQPPVSADGQPLNDMAALIAGFSTLQSQVMLLQNELDQGLNRYIRNLDIAARIGRETATLYDTDVLLNRAIDLISREYGFYHAQVFLIDDIGKNAVLVYSFGEAGKEMLRRRHKLAVGGDSIIGRVTATGQPTIVNDTQAPGTAHKFNPLLPNTRAEMALPLQVGDQIIGALDMQSQTPGVFREDDLYAFQLLADQIAVALQNARLLVDSRERLSQIDQLNRQLTRMAWEDSAARDNVQDVYQYDLMRVEKEQQVFGGEIEQVAPADAHSADLAPYTVAAQDEALDEVVSERAMRMPITVRGQVIGAIDVQADEDRAFTTGDEAIMRAVADRVSIALENRRLFEETQLNLAETSTLYQLSRYLNEASNLDEIIQALIISVVPDGSGGFIAVFDEYMPMVGPNWSEIIAEWGVDEIGIPQEGNLRGIEFQLRDYPTLREMDSASVLTLSNIADADPALRDLLGSVDVQSLILIPFSVRGLYRGIICIHFNRERQFLEREKRLYAALIDQAGVAVDNRMLLEQNEQALTRIERLYSGSRQINIASSAFDLVQAAVNSTEDRHFDYLLGVIEGNDGEEANDPAASDGWLGNLRIIAYSHEGEVLEDERHFPFAVEADSPLRAREPIVATGQTPDSAFSHILDSYGFSFGAAFPLYSANQPIALFIIATHGARDLNEAEFEVYRALTGQMSTVLQNRRLLDQTEQDRARLSSVLETLPAGVLVLDSKTLLPIQINEQMEEMFGQRIPVDQPFSITRYGMVRSDTRDPYPPEDMPVFAAIATDTLQFADDITIARPDGSSVDLLVNAAPIHDANGQMQAIVAAFQNISPLRTLENSLQQNLRDTIALYETTRALVEAEEADDVIAQLVDQLAAQEPLDVQVALLDEERGGTFVVRSLSGYLGQYNLPDELLSPDRVRVAERIGDDTALPTAARSLLAARGAAAYATVPLRSRAGGFAPLGWLIILYPTAQTFTPEREQFLTTLGDSAAVALDNRNLFKSTEQALEETNALYSATTGISRVRDLEALAASLQTSLEALRPDVYAAYLLTEERGLVELFNINLDGASVDFQRMVQEHDLLVAGAISIDDLRAVLQPSPFVRELIATNTLNAIQVVPLRAKGLPRGAMFVGYHNAHRGTPGEARYLSALGESASVVADNILLFDEIQSTLRETATLYLSSRRMSDAATAEDVLQSIVDNLQGRSVTLAFIAQLAPEFNSWNEPDARADVSANWTSTPEGIDLRGIIVSAEEFPAWRLLTLPTVTMIDDVQSPDADLDEIERAGLISLDMRSVAILPLRFGGRAAGVLVFSSPEPYTHNERDQRIYTSLAEQASIRLEAARLLDQTERRARQLATSAQVSQIASSILNLEELLPRLVNTIRDSFGYNHVQIFLMDEEDDYALLRASTGEPGEQLLAIGHKLQKGSRSVIGQVTATGKPQVARDTADSRAVHRPNPYLPNTRSELAIPLIIKGRTVGALDVQSDEPNVFDDDDIATLTILAAQVSVAIDNAQLFQQSRRRANEMSFLFSVTTAAASATRTSEALQNVANELSEALEAMSVVIYLPRQYVEGIGSDERTVTLLRPAALSGVNGAGQPLSELSDIALNDAGNRVATAAMQRRPIILNRLADEPTYFPVVADAQSAIIVPLSSGAQLIGVTVLESDKPDAFDDNTLTLLLTLAGTLSAIVQNQNLLETLQNTNEQLRELDRIKSDFLANMSHELRTPLNSIIGFSRVILKGIDGPLTEMQEQDLSTIYNSGLHLLNLINDILDQAKIAAGKMDMQADYFEMKSVIDGVRSIGIGLIKDKPIDLRVNLAPGLPRAFGDEFRTRQVLLNLVSNASKFTREGSITIDAYVVEHDGHPFLRVDVTDTGIGIAENDMASLFEAFRQVDSSLTRTVGGTGLGLPIAKSLTEMQGGQMLVASQVNVGSVFSILVPTAPGFAQEQNAEQEASEAPAPPAPTPSSTQMKKTGMLNPDAVAHLNTGTATGTTAGANGESSNAAGQHDTERHPISGLHAGIPPSDDEEADPNQDTNLFLRPGQTRHAAPSASSAPPPAPPTPAAPSSTGRGNPPSDRNARQKMATTDLSLVRPPRPVKRQILLIEDNPEMVDQLRRALGREGFDIFSASIPLEAEAMASGLHPTLIVMDVNFSKGAGWDILKRLQARDDTADIPIVVVSLSAEVERALAEGVFRFLSRPFTPEALVNAVREAEKESRVQRILIIDDQPESVRLLAQTLQLGGHYRVFSASNGVEGISLVAHRRPDLILLDLRMPEMDGFQVIRELRDNPETTNIPILVVTAETLTAEEQAQLSQYRVIYKADLQSDLQAERTPPLVDDVQQHLGQGTD